MAAPTLLLLGSLAMLFAFAFASDPSSLQDFCVADPMSPGALAYNGFPDSIPIRSVIYEIWSI
ncbi:putative germin-like protein 12-4 [Tripterygium wilfordii]|uniref:Putative germin-like protein 12-4 n=1 Tax=Tripterygium wilfordii TaxID=458696 RepID=A0A7J7CHU1_TRIWF|nr:putative germin-like protein 12-4 [Tripterygium wilfordii]